jgi:hypothetical protein
MKKTYTLQFCKNGDVKNFEEVTNEILRDAKEIEGREWSHYETLSEIKKLYAERGNNFIEQTFIIN